MGTNSAGLQPEQPDTGALSRALAALSLRCVECAALYPGLEAQPRYRCECGGVLDVETVFQHPWPQEESLQEGYNAL
ncbi:MAG TPA: hypothetical protein VJO32_18010, partial [Ktedonobacteraceae bacterium]|nr:hypothetical protein [Ktedonobacteraceae bacterium]